MAEFLSAIGEFWDTIKNLFSHIGFADVVDVVIVALLIYEVIILVRHTRAQQLAVGICVLILSYAFASAADLRTLQFVLNAIMQFGIVVLAVVFQPELRRALEQVGGVNSTFSRMVQGNKQMEEGLRAQWQSAIVAVCDAAERMAEQKTGALIVLERKVNLNEIIRTGTPLHSDVNVEGLTTIFYEGTPLHDGAAVIREAKLEAAGCFLPLSNNLEIGKDMGTRHRAALGMSENADAIIVVVSEETGIISLAKNGVLIRRLGRQNLFNMLVGDMLPPKEEAQKRGWFRRKAARGAGNEEK
ncbi:diadenylate cyclase CdaA [Ruminococcaceae bacterium OttesenSCG-928-A16]|nr:diadenylate cyclase CdaA [Ruminococcaceae bacterium OttesenSCG-928-A16]